MGHPLNSQPSQEYPIQAKLVRFAYRGYSGGPMIGDSIRVRMGGLNTDRERLYFSHDPRDPENELVWLERELDLPAETAPAVPEAPEGSPSLPSAPAVPMGGNLEALLVKFMECSTLVVGGLENQAERYKDEARQFLLSPVAKAALAKLEGR